MRKHPNQETLRQFVSGELESEKIYHIEQHLSICSDCRSLADKILTPQMVRLLDSWLHPGYDDALDRVADRTADCLAGVVAESRDAEDLLADVLREPIPGRRRKIANNERFHSLKLCQSLQSRSRNAWFSDPTSALEMADLAVEVALHLESGRYGSDLVEDSQATAWAYLGNAFRITSDFWKAEQALRRAWAHHLRAGGDAYTEAELFIFTASLRENQGRYEEAERLSDQAIRLYREGQDAQLEGAALILKGMVLGSHNRTREGIPVIRAGLSQIDPVDDPLLFFAGRHNLIWSLNHDGASGEAQELLERWRPLYRDLGAINLARIHWLDGEIARDLGDFAKSESIIQGVREFFIDRSLVKEVFLSSLDLAALYALSGRRRRVKEVLSEMIPLGEALGLSRQTLSARILFERASRS